MQINRPDQSNLQQNTNTFSSFSLLDVVSSFPSLEAYDVYDVKHSNDHHSNWQKCDPLIWDFCVDPPQLSSNNRHHDHIVTCTRRKKIKFPFARFLGLIKTISAPPFPFLGCATWTFLAGALPTLSSSTDSVSRVSLATADIASQGYRYGHINAAEALRKQEDPFFSVASRNA